MCSISGAWRFTDRDLRPEIDASMFAMRHRGPDGEGRLDEHGIALGMRRLAVIDLVDGNQPAWNEAGDIAVVMNGEIYNYVELLEAARLRGHRVATRSDTEAVVHEYEDQGLAFVERLRGMFALAVFDRRRKRLVLARDRFGKKPLYYATVADRQLVFASEIKGLLPLLRSVGIVPSINKQAIYDYLTLGSIPQPATAYEQVQALSPGSVLIADDAGIRVHRYWEPQFEPRLEVDYAVAQEMVRDRVAEAVRIRLRSDVPVGVFLSAGVDSSVVTYEAARIVGESLRTFTVATGDPELDESHVARRTASRFGVRNTVLRLVPDPVRDIEAVVAQYDQPFADSSAIPSMHISRAAREHVTVVLNGDGGDELFGGYRRHVIAHTLGGIKHVPAGAVSWLADALVGGGRPRRSIVGFAARALRGLALTPSERYVVWTSDMLTDSEKRPAWRGGAAVQATEERVAEALGVDRSALNRQIHAELRLNLPSALLVKMDIATSAASLEARSPFMDQEVAALALRLPPSFRIRGTRTKAVLRDAYAHLLPREVVSAAKRGFEVPLGRWLANEWKPLVQDTLGTPGARVRAYVDDSLVDCALRSDGFPAKNSAYITYAFLVLELWLRSVDDGHILRKL